MTGHWLLALTGKLVACAVGAVVLLVILVAVDKPDDPWRHVG